MIFFIKNEKKVNDSFAWTEQKLKRNLNSLSYFEKSPGVVVITGAGAGAVNVIFSAPAPAKNYGSGRLRLRNTGSKTTQRPSTAARSGLFQRMAPQIIYR